MLNNTTQAPDEKLPDTGIGLELERLLSSIFIKSEKYGTRCSTIITLDKDNKSRFTESTYNHVEEKFETISFDFRIEPDSYL